MSAIIKVLFWGYQLDNMDLWVYFSHIISLNVRMQLFSREHEQKDYSIYKMILWQKKLQKPEIAQIKVLKKINDLYSSETRWQLSAAVAIFQ